MGNIKLHNMLSNVIKLLILLIYLHKLNLASIFAPL
jgi:hypothetical protein